MGAKSTFRVNMRRKDGKSKYLMTVLGISTKTYRNNNGNVIKSTHIYRKTEKNVRNG